MRFNSKLVRLKGLARLAPAVLASSFQFQTGAIKSDTRSGLQNASLSKFQFQTGAIKSSRAVTLTPMELWMFQFQTGAIKRGYYQKG